VKTSTPTPQAKLRPSTRRIVEAILFLIEEAERRRTYVTKYDIVKTLFVADSQHLNNYGRPITFDNYYAMENGPVPTEAMSMLEPSYDGGSFIGAEWPLWSTEPSPEDGPKARKYVRPKRSPNLRVLSATDVSALEDALTAIKAQSFGQVRDLTHRHRAYQEAWARRGGKGSVLMDYGLLFDTPDPEALEELVHASKHI
jgi:hypothetical protein